MASYGSLKVIRNGTVFEYIRGVFFLNVVLDIILYNLCHRMFVWNRHLIFIIDYCNARSSILSVCTISRQLIMKMAILRTYMHSSDEN